MENQKQSIGLVKELISELNHVVENHKDRTNEFVKSVKDIILSETAIYGSVQNEHINLILGASRNMVSYLQALIDKLENEKSL